jgi:hypothetical protein
MVLLIKTDDYQQQQQKHVTQARMWLKMGLIIKGVYCRSLPPICSPNFSFMGGVGKRKEVAKLECEK